MGKKINAFVEGKIVEIKQVENDRYFILDPLYLSSNTLIEDKINITTAQLKYDIQALEQMIDNGEFHQLIRDTILEPKVGDELKTDYKNLTDKIKNLKEYNQLKERRIKDEEGNIKINNPVNEFFECLSYESVYFNTRPDYFYEDIKAEEIELNKDMGLYNQSSAPILSPLDNAIYKKTDKELEEAEIFKKLTSKIRKLEEFRILNDKIVRYRSIAPVTFENIERIIELVNNN